MPGDIRATLSLAVHLGEAGAGQGVAAVAGFLVEEDGQEAVV